MIRLFENLITIFIYYMLEDDFITNIIYDIDRIVAEVCVVSCISIMIIKVIKEHKIYDKVVREVVPKLRP